MLAILVLTPGTRRFSFWISFKLVDLVDFGLHVRGGALHLNRDCVHQRFERSWIVREPATSSLVCADLGIIIFLAKPSIGRSAALKTWQCASMMRSIRGGAGCAKLSAGNAALPAVSAIPPATSSRRRIVYLVLTLPKAIRHDRIVLVQRGCEHPWQRLDPHTGCSCHQYAYSVKTGSTLPPQAP